jgi:AmmeMemoRadiSam system protein A
MSPFAALTVPEGRQLLDLSRKALEHVVRQQRPPMLREADLPEALLRPVPCFVSLSCRDELRGCIGHLVAPCPLHQGVRENTVKAATTDPRFSPLVPAELHDARIEISLLSDLQPVACDVPDDLPYLLRPHQDGVVLHLGEQLTTFLPQVWNQIHDPVEFLDRLARKAGGDASSWRAPGARISRYQVEIISEPR